MYNMLGLKVVFFWIDHLPEFGYFGYKFKYLNTIFHIEFAEKSQKIRTVAIW